MAQKETDPTNLHDLAVDAQVDIHKLAVGLAHMGAEPQAVQQLSKMAGALADVAKQLAAAPLPGQAGPAAQGPQPGAAPAPGPGGQPIPAPTGAPATPPAAGPMAAGAAATHAMMMEAAQRRAGR